VIKPEDKWKWVAGCVAAVVLIALYIAGKTEIEIVVAPEWTVRVVDTNGDPVPLAAVREEWKHPAFDDTIRMQDVLTREDGIAQFPKRTIRTNWFERNSACSRYRRRAGPNAPCIPQTRVFAFKCSYGAPQMGGRHEDFYPGEIPAMESKLVLQRCQPVDFEFGCFPHPVRGVPACKQ
jgi:hypothetical protein